MMSLFAALLISCLFSGAVSSRCPSMARNQYPEHGSVQCDIHGREKTCYRKCELPYFPLDPELREVYCGRDTDYVWSYDRYQNATQVPACERPIKCMDLEQNRTELHGFYTCQQKDGSSSITCDIECDLGYIGNGKHGGQQVFCGPITAFRWSYEWSQPPAAQKKLPGCKKSLVTVKLEIDYFGSCEASKSLQEFIVRPFLLKLYSPAPNQPELGRFINKQTECTSEDGNSSKILLFFNVEEYCYEGTCKDACKLLPFKSKNTTEDCHEMCKNYHINNNENLAQLRRVIHRYIAGRLATVDIASFFTEGGLYGQQASLVSMSTEIADEPYDQSFRDCSQS